MGVLVRVSRRSELNRINICCKRGFLDRFTWYGLSCPDLVVYKLVKLRTQQLLCLGGWKPREVPIWHWRTRGFLENYWSLQGQRRWFLSALNGQCTHQQNHERSYFSVSGRTGRCCPLWGRFFPPRLILPGTTSPHPPQARLSVAFRFPQVNNQDQLSQ